MGAKMTDSGGEAAHYLHDLERSRAQVCDKCRKLKRRCFGTASRCTNCLLNDHECTTERLLKRKRKPNPAKLTPLEVENMELRLKLQKLEELLSNIEESYLLSPFFHQKKQGFFFKEKQSDCDYNNDMNDIFSDF